MLWPTAQDLGPAPAVVEAIGNQLESALPLLGALRWSSQPAEYPPMPKTKRASI